MKQSGSFEWSAERREPTPGSLNEWGDDRSPDPRDRSPIEDPQWPYLNPTFPKRPYRMTEDNPDIEPPRSPKTAWSERPPKSPKDVPESDTPRSPKAPTRRFGRLGSGSGDSC